MSAMKEKKEEKGAEGRRREVSDDREKGRADGGRKGREARESER